MSEQSTSAMPDTNLYLSLSPLSASLLKWTTISIVMRIMYLQNSCAGGTDLLLAVVFISFIQQLSEFHHPSEKVIKVKLRFDSLFPSFIPQVTRNTRHISKKPPPTWSPLADFLTIRNFREMLLGVHLARIWSTCNDRDRMYAKSSPKARQAASPGKWQTVSMGYRAYLLLALY